MHVKCERAISKLKLTNNIFAYMFFEIQFYIYWFVFERKGRAIFAIFLFAIFLVNLELHAIHPSARMDAKQTMQMKKLEQALVLNNSTLEKNEMRDNFNPSIITWRSKNYGDIYNHHLEILNSMRILKNKAFVQNGFDSWQNRLMNALPRIWILNAHLKKLSYNLHIRFNLQNEHVKTIKVSSFREENKSIGDLKK